MHVPSMYLANHGALDLCHRHARHPQACEKRDAAVHIDSIFCLMAAVSITDQTFVIRSDAYT